MWLQVAPTMASRRLTLWLSLLAVGVASYFLFMGFLLWRYEIPAVIQYRLQEYYDSVHEEEQMEAADIYCYLNFIYEIRSADDEALHKCRLEEYPDGWTEDAVRIVDLDRDPLKNCDRSFTPLTKLVMGRVLVVAGHSDEKNVSCRAREILWKKDLDYDTGKWQKIETTLFTSDAVHVQCVKEATNFEGQNIFYSFVHHQIYRDPKTGVDAKIEEAAKRHPRPNVHIILLDSLGNSAIRRLMPRDLSFMRGELGAVEFRHLNKVGENSRPNGAAFLLGLQLETFDRSLLNLPSVPADYNSSFFCNSLDLDKPKMVIREFQKRGYVTMLSDDWSQGVFNFPNCRGYQKMPATHYNRPYILLRERDRLVKETMSKENCMDSWHMQLDCLEQFINAYPERPKASMTWITWMAHDNNDDAIAQDDRFFKFLSKNRAEFDKPFVFFMSDHGMRWGRISKTRIGAIERNSAFLMVAPPRWLRHQKTLVTNMRLNADILVTQFDVHATLLDLVETLPESDFASFSALPPNPALRGSSLFRPLPEGPINCFTLPIPFEYCMCTMEYLVVRDAKVEEAAAQETARNINEILASRNLESLCHKIESASVVKMKAMKRTDGLFWARVQTQPGYGEFEVWLRDIGPRGSPFFVSASTSFARVNQYGHDADCLTSTGFEDMRPYCYCK